ncbi:Cysteine-rich small domain-containing protein [Dethiosulfatibacter aminovorans DSM 17477]|uniref:Cysteine-rich small domain-containing protein n=1 Tax=Dethiosulfatibacter aminovorans DSM 17477 TaxID=1121476 RepID=A0A1M6L7Q0_9FIRM|nr:cysteine-rich small domain-containing protein [Dethiosulfatibacter aminovorans]SHJ67236.1 Cysteine-rich small domain-containing protein [Dethiosulfatibacter aminovorans DSM 17477]
MGKHRRDFETENFKFVQNRACEYFPCHKGVPEDKFNCLFCFCPLYMLKDECGGNYEVKNDIKDCTNCAIPHSPGGYDYIMSKMDEVIKRGSDF